MLILLIGTMDIASNTSLKMDVGILVNALANLEGITK